MMTPVVFNWMKTCMQQWFWQITPLLSPHMPLLFFVKLCQITVYSLKTQLCNAVSMVINLIHWGFCSQTALRACAERKKGRARGREHGKEKNKRRKREEQWGSSSDRQADRNAVVARRRPWRGDGWGNATWCSVYWFNQLTQPAINHHQAQLR